MTLLDAVAVYLALKDRPSRNVGEDMVLRQAWRMIWQHAQDALKTAQRKED